MGGSCVTEGYVVPAPLVTPVMLLLNNMDTLLSGNHGRNRNTELTHDDIVLYMNKVNPTTNWG